MSEFALLGRDALPDIADLCTRAIAQPPTIDELDATLFAPEQPAVVRGDPSVGVVATATCDDGAHVRFLAVDPSLRRHGHGHALVDLAEQDARAAGQHTLLTGADAPYFLWPGIPSTETGLVCLFERHHYFRSETNFDMRVELDSIPEDPGGHALATVADRDEIEAWTRTHWA